MRRRTSTVLLFGAVAGLAMVLTAGPASAHVTADGEVERGGFGVVTFRVPNEREDSGTMRLSVQMPQDTPLGSVSVQPKPGWTVEVTRRTLDEPLEVFGSTVSEVVDTVTWTGGPLEPGQFDTFSISAGPFPDTDQIEFPAIQTYESGEEVAWIDETVAGEPEPEHPAPVVELAAESSSGTEESVPPGGDEVATPSGDDEGTDALAIVALVVGVVALVAAGFATVLARRSR